MRKKAIEKFGIWGRRGIEIINELYKAPAHFAKLQREIERKYSVEATMVMRQRVIDELWRQLGIYALDDPAWGVYFRSGHLDEISLDELGYDDFDQKVMSNLPEKYQTYYQTYSRFVSLIREITALIHPDIAGWYSVLERYFQRIEPVNPLDVHVFNYGKFDFDRLQRSLAGVTDLAQKVAYYESMKVEFERMKKFMEQGAEYRIESYDPDFVAKCDIEIQAIRDTRPSHRRIIWLGKPAELGCLISQLVESGYIEAEKYKSSSDFNKAAMSRLLEECFELRNGEFSSLEKMFDRISSRGDFSKCLSGLPSCKK